ncbi:MAG TPA: hypothetical protein P5121_18060 [Caldilineaceae bacterium]|nr:hypothetical protein [Caldilineaceae bacterium]
MGTDGRKSVGQPLADEQLRDEGLYQGLDLKPLTKRLVNALMLDRQLTPALISDFGVESPDHYRALKDALFSDPAESDNRDQDQAVTEAKSRDAFRRRIVELDAAYGHAAKLNAFVKKNAPECADRVHFEPTDWDYLYGRVEEDSQR